MKHTTLFFTLVYFMLFITSNTYAQSVQLSAKCGDVLESEFKNSKEHQDIEISMNSGDSFEVTVVPIGDHLKIRAEIYDPGGTVVPNSDKSGMFKSENQTSLVIQSGVLSANGKYKIRLYNYWSGRGKNVGAYTAYFKCIKKNGEVINPKQ